MLDDPRGHARTLWTYHCIPDPPAPADVILGLGSYDLRVADRCAELYQLGLAPRIVFSGRHGNWTRELFSDTEARVFAARARQRGVPAEKILLEERASNTGENLRYSRELLDRAGLEIDRAILVGKGNMLRRGRATARLVWPELGIRFQCPSPRWEDQPAPRREPDDFVNEMVGDLHRILVYPSLGFQASEAVPEHVLVAYRELIAAGYDRHLLAGHPPEPHA